MEQFRALRTEVSEANLLKDLVGPWGLEPQTSTVSTRSISPFWVKGEEQVVMLSFEAGG
jgi:hypothetical protein